MQDQKVLWEWPKDLPKARHKDSFIGTIMQDNLCKCTNHSAAVMAQYVLMWHYKHGHSTHTVRKTNHGHTGWRDEHPHETASVEPKLISNKKSLGQAIVKSQEKRKEKKGKKKHFVMTACCHHKTCTHYINHAFSKHPCVFLKGGSTAEGKIN